MGRKGNTVLIILLVVSIGFILFLAVPLGGRLGQFREEVISFIFRKPPRFISMELNVNGFPKTIRAGQSLKITGNETIVIKRIHANTFFDKYLTADVVGFGKDDDMREPINTALVRKQLMDAGIRSVPIEISYIDHVIAKIPLEIELGEQDFMVRINETKDMDARIAILKSAHAAFPREPKFVAMLDEYLTKRNDFETLAGIYRGMVELDPEDLVSYGQLSRCYLKLGMYREALAASQKIVDKGRADAATYRRMALIAGENGDFEERVRYLEKALKLEPASDAIIIDLAKTYEQADRGDKALEIYRAAAGRARDREILIPVIEDALKKKNYQEAASVLKRYISFYPGDKNAYAQLGMAMGKMGKTEDQTEYYSKAADLNPKDPILLYNLAVTYEKAGKAASALEVYKKVLALKPGDRDSLVRAAVLSQRSGEFGAAYDYYQTLVKIDGSSEHKKGLISAAVGLKDTDRIIDACRSYLKAARDHDAAITLAYAYETRAASKTGKQKLEDLNAALDAYRLALKINPRSKKAQEKIPELKIETIKLKRGT